MVQKAPNKGRNKARFQVPLGLARLGENAPTPQVPILPDSSDSHIGLGERVRLLLTAVTATSCRTGEGEVRSKTTRTTPGKDHGASTLDICSRWVTRRVSVQVQQKTRPLVLPAPLGCLLLMLPPCASTAWTAFQGRKFLWIIWFEAPFYRLLVTFAKLLNHLASVFSL